MIDFAEIEDVKENVQPLRAGRNAKELSKQVRGLKDQPLTSTVTIFEEGCKEWEGCKVCEGVYARHMGGGLNATSFNHNGNDWV